MPADYALFNSTDNASNIYPVYYIQVLCYRSQNMFVIFDIYPLKRCKSIVASFELVTGVICFSRKMKLLIYCLQSWSSPGPISWYTYTWPIKHITHLNELLFSTIDTHPIIVTSKLIIDAELFQLWLFVSGLVIISIYGKLKTRGPIHKKIQ